MHYNLVYLIVSLCIDNFIHLTAFYFSEEEEASEGYGSESVLDPINQIINKFIEQQPGVKKLEELEPTAVVVFGKVLPVRRKYHAGFCSSIY